LISNGTGLRQKKRRKKKKKGKEKPKKQWELREKRTWVTGRRRGRAHDTEKPESVKKRRIDLWVEETRILTRKEEKKR